MRVKWKRKVFWVDLDKDPSLPALGMLQAQLESLTSVPPANQKLLVKRKQLKVLQQYAQYT